MANLSDSYDESFERDVRGPFNGLVTGAESLQELQQWLMEHEAVIDERASPQLYEEVERIEHIIAEYTGGHIDAAVAISEIASAAGESFQTLPQSSRKRAKRAS